MEEKQLLDCSTSDVQCGKKFPPDSPPWESVSLGSSLTSSEDRRLNYSFPKLSGQGGDKTASTLAEDDMFSQVNLISYPMA